MRLGHRERHSKDLTWNIPTFLWDRKCQLQGEPVKVEYSQFFMGYRENRDLWIPNSSSQSSLPCQGQELWSCWACFSQLEFPGCWICTCSLLRFRWETFTPSLSRFSSGFCLSGTSQWSSSCGISGVLCLGSVWGDDSMGSSQNTGRDPQGSSSPTPTPRPGWENPNESKVPKELKE